jgi:2,3-dihydroxyphenylpropionate 1,2-dioxygenase
MRSRTSGSDAQLKSLIGDSEEELDRAGNIELRCWPAAAGMLGERKPDIVSMNPSWHHNYASLGWWGGPPAPAALHYPSIKPELVGLIDAFHALAHGADRRADYLADRGACADRFGLTAEQRAALIALDHQAIVSMGTHPLLPFLARMQVERPRRS